MKKLLIFKFDVSKLFFVLRKLNLKSPFFSFYLSHRMSSLEEKRKYNSHDWFLVQKYRYILKMKKPLCYCILIWIMIPIECVCVSQNIYEREKLNWQCFCRGTIFGSNVWCVICVCVHFCSLHVLNALSVFCWSQVASVTPATSVAKNINTTAASRSTVTYMQLTVTIYIYLF